MSLSIHAAARRREEKLLTHPLATRSAASRGRRTPEPEDPMRLCFERDAHRILHSTAFRRLRYKTQVFFAPENDHLSTRVDHSLYVASIAQTIARSLGLNEDLAYAIALGHDLGHSPFGHAGEEALDKLARDRPDGARFMHELHSLRVVDRLAMRPSTREPGLNLSYEVRDGILCHCGERTEQYLSPRAPGGECLEQVDRRGLPPATLEGCIVRLVDRVAYVGRDLEDARQVFDDLPPLPREAVRLLGDDNRSIIHALVNDMVGVNLATPGRIGFTDEVFAAVTRLYKYNFHHIYLHPRLSDYAVKVERMLGELFRFGEACLAARDRSEWGAPRPDDPEPARELHRFIAKTYPPAAGERPPAAQLLVDHLSLMTDRYARNAFEAIMLPATVG